jgi:hypothetical protein
MAWMNVRSLDSGQPDVTRKDERLMLMLGLLIWGLLMVDADLVLQLSAGGLSLF